MTAPPRPRRYAKPDERTRPRRCLSCGRFFKSYHAGNRICERCSNQRNFQALQAGIPEHGIVK